jgi:hypothetical protein
MSVSFTDEQIESDRHASVAKHLWQVMQFVSRL